MNHVTGFERLEAEGVLKIRDMDTRSSFESFWEGMFSSELLFNYKTQSFTALTGYPPSRHIARTITLWLSQICYFYNPNWHLGYLKKTS